jgi:hypothetical protein
MDVNYSRWMSKDPDAEPDVIEDEPRRFRLRWPTRSAVASTAMVSLIVLGGGAFVRSIATPDASAEQAQTAESPTAKKSNGPGAASVDDSTSDDSTYDDPTYETTDDDTNGDSSPPTGPRLMEQRELHRSKVMAPSGPSGDRPQRGHREPALPPPMLAP